jgi:bifunctional non-homologous end joining protein LigD
VSKRRFGAYAIETSNEGKIFFPGSGITKGEVIAYYERIAEYMLPYLAERPLVVQRFPDGIANEGFYQKQIGEYFPDWITTVQVEVGASGDRQELVVCDRLATLVYLANQACITLHPWLSRRDKLHHPDSLVIDLDPAADDFEPARVASLRVKKLFDALGLPSFPKLTGSRGVHVTVPLDRGEDFDSVREFARTAAELLAARHSDDLTVEQRKEKRRGRLYVDVGRNAYGQTAVAPWSVRPLPGAPVAAPIAWPDLERKRIGPRSYTMRNVFRSLAQRGDPWTAAKRAGRSLRKAREELVRLHEKEVR